MSITRPPTMSPEDMDKLLKQLEQILNRPGDRGASVVVQDPRITSLTNWFLAAIIVAMVGGFSWQLSTLSDMRQQNARLLAQIEEMQRVNSAQDNRLGEYDGRLRAVERAIR